MTMMYFAHLPNFVLGFFIVRDLGVKWRLFKVLGEKYMKNEHNIVLLSWGIFLKNCKEYVFCLSKIETTSYSFYLELNSIINDELSHRKKIRQNLICFILQEKLEKQKTALKLNKYLAVNVTIDWAVFSLSLFIIIIRNHINT